nr:MAG TPA: hypothetical protein [Bacteriophage sp.]
MRRLISYGNVYSKDTKKKLSEITVEECLNFMEFEIWNKYNFTPPIIYYKSYILILS